MTIRARVLLVEDDAFLSRACTACLRQCGFDVLVASEGEAGLRLARSDRPDVILLDLLIPRLAGIDVLRALKRDPATASIPVLILSNSSRDEDRTQTLQLGAAGYYVKTNLSLKTLAGNVADLLERLGVGHEATP